MSKIHDAVYDVAQEAAQDLVDDIRWSDHFEIEDMVDDAINNNSDISNLSDSVEGLSVSVENLKKVTPTLEDLRGLVQDVLLSFLPELRIALAPSQPTWKVYEVTEKDMAEVVDGKDLP